METFASVGEEMNGISVIGESGLLAVAESAKLSGMIDMDETMGENSRRNQVRNRAKQSTWRLTLLPSSQT